MCFVIALNVRLWRLWNAFPTASLGCESGNAVLRMRCPSNIPQMATLCFILACVIASDGSRFEHHRKAKRSDRPIVAVGKFDRAYFRRNVTDFLSCRGHRC
jgi:hypothetical protein